MPKAAPSDVRSQSSNAIDCHYAELLEQNHDLQQRQLEGTKYIDALTPLLKLDVASRVVLASAHKIFQEKFFYSGLIIDIRYMHESLRAKGLFLVCPHTETLYG